MDMDEDELKGLIRIWLHDIETERVMRDVPRKYLTLLGQMLRSRVDDEMRDQFVMYFVRTAREEFEKAQPNDTSSMVPPEHAEAVEYGWSEHDEAGSGSDTCSDTLTEPASGRYQLYIEQALQVGAVVREHYVHYTNKDKHVQIIREAQSLLSEAARMLLTKYRMQKSDVRKLVKNTTRSMRPITPLLHEADNQKRKLLRALTTKMNTPARQETLNENEAQIVSILKVAELPDGAYMSSLVAAAMEENLVRADQSRLESEVRNVPVSPNNVKMHKNVRELVYDGIKVASLIHTTLDFVRGIYDQYEHLQYEIHAGSTDASLQRSCQWKRGRVHDNAVSALNVLFRMRYAHAEETEDMVSAIETALMTAGYYWFWAVLDDDENPMSASMALELAKIAWARRNEVTLPVLKHLSVSGMARKDRCVQLALVSLQHVNRKGNTSEQTQANTLRLEIRSEHWERIHDALIEKVDHDALTLGLRHLGKIMHNLGRPHTEELDNTVKALIRVAGFCAIYKITHPEDNLTAVRIIKKFHAQWAACERPTVTMERESVGKHVMTILYSVFTARRETRPEMLFNIVDYEYIIRALEMGHHPVIEGVTRKKAKNAILSVLQNMTNDLGSGHIKRCSALQQAQKEPCDSIMYPTISENAISHLVQQHLENLHTCGLHVLAMPTKQLSLCLKDGAKWSQRLNWFSAGKFNWILVNMLNFSALCDNLLRKPCAASHQQLDKLAREQVKH